MPVCDADEHIEIVKKPEALVRVDGVAWLVALEEDEPLEDFKKESDGGSEGDGTLEGVNPLLWVAILGL